MGKGGAFSNALKNFKVHHKDENGAAVRKNHTLHHHIRAVLYRLKKNRMQCCVK